MLALEFRKHENQQLHLLTVDETHSLLPEPHTVHTCCNLSETQGCPCKFTWQEYLCYMALWKSNLIINSWLWGLCCTFEDLVRAWPLVCCYYLGFRLHLWLHLCRLHLWTHVNTGGKTRRKNDIKGSRWSVFMTTLNICNQRIHEVVYVAQRCSAGCSWHYRSERANAIWNKCAAF